MPFVRNQPDIRRIWLSYKAFCTASTLWHMDCWLTHVQRNCKSVSQNEISVVDGTALAIGSVEIQELPTFRSVLGTFV
ncbi:hypothetical protein Pr1d_02140 [Bythopirellula goksoeyrii]|uniref:Uncharacterized protein n=1 Tax=Bythopirellula goksoeyrii TaxID=1400387 RepID=A0A5B9QF63_9BACT|nr:hypothetical protein Pr1d_02140 [Bythopirellula goksoeyrii]